MNPTQAPVIPQVGPDLLSPLPQELMQNITKFLSASDNCNLRLVSKAVEKHTHVYFTENCYYAVHTDLSLKSLESLLEVAKVHTIAANMKLLDIEAHSLSFGQGFNWPPRSSGMMAFGHQDHPCVPLLETIIEKLGNCQSFRVNNICSAADHSNWMVPRSADASVAIEVLFDVICHLRRPTKSLSLEYGRCMVFPVCAAPTLNPGPFFVHPVIFQPFQDAWRTLETLALRGTMSSRTLTENANLIFEATNLRELVLDFRCSAGTPDAATAMMNRMRQLPLAGRMPPILKLDILGGETTDSDFLHFLSLFGTSLRSLRLVDCVSILGTASNWWDVFDNMATHLPLLETISIDHLTIPRAPGYIRVFEYPGLYEEPVIPGTNGDRCEIYEPSPGYYPDESRVSYTGPNMGKFLQALSNGAIVSLVFNH
ncbi:uncharacterized protein BP5553_07511 [Venustampulla echinocandica]|uniref:F-box domain-containing protein n=1 Tax=Venustampulla echinocandica TaxID=2656787 RepID=A0A370TGS3_9HELO|nr:uncharacterized protein BP5553_07511 [Venustampulla echinocandica]RDL34383.1 hypothetical protein BP5553_07511 [Venustampulla echinocandica]